MPSRDFRGRLPGAPTGPAGAAVEDDSIPYHILAPGHHTTGIGRTSEDCPQRVRFFEALAARRMPAGGAETGPGSRGGG
ncbi:MAG: hypothetical protein AAB654_00870 [Acidobacteriota bacterium]